MQGQSLLPMYPVSRDFSVRQSGSFPGGDSHSHPSASVDDSDEGSRKVGEEMIYGEDDGLL